MITTIIILLSISFGAAIGLCLSTLIIPASINDAWHEGYDQARADFAEEPDRFTEPPLTGQTWDQNQWTLKS